MGRRVVATLIALASGASVSASSSTPVVAGCPAAPMISAAAASVVPVLASDGLRVETATGFSIGAGRFVTVAHAVAGARDVRVGAAQSTGSVIAVDSRRDLAVVAAPGLHLRALHPADGAATATSCAVVLAERGGRAVAVGATVRRSLQVSIDVPVAARRTALELAVDVRRGDSGSPVLDGSGAVEGVVFAVSRDATATGWAVSASELSEFLALKM